VGSFIEDVGAGNKAMIVRKELFLPGDQPLKEGLDGRSIPSRTGLHSLLPEAMTLLGREK
jgi:hypothetical protein